MKVGFAARWSPLDKRSWSGTSYYSFQQIKQRHEVEIFQFKWTWWVRERLTTQKSFNRLLFKKQTSVEYLRSYAKFFSRQLEKELKKRPVDVLFVSASPQLVAYMETSIPVIYMSDATFQQLQGYYPNFSNLATYNVEQGIALDKLAYEKAAHCMLASEWHKQSAIHDYGIDPQKISVVPLGANMDRIPDAKELVTAPKEYFRLLFLGVEWERKGGEIALEAFRILRRYNINVQLHIIGCVPPHDLSAEKEITVIPFLDKNKEEDFQQLHRIFLDTDILLLPTRAECAGVVFSEAAAYGIPSLATDTGGVSDYVKDKVNGYILPETAGAQEYATVLEKMLTDKELLATLKLSSRTWYEQQLNWERWGKEFEKIVGSAAFSIKR